MARAIPDTTWQSILSKENFRTEFKIQIQHSATSIREFLSDKIIDFQITRPLFSKYEVGNATCAQLVFTLDSTLNPQNGAAVYVFARVVADNETSSWIDYGTFYIDSRKRNIATKTTTFTAYDDMYKAEAICAETIAFPFFPYPFLETVTAIANYIGVGIEAKTLNFLFESGHDLEYPNELTMREVLGYIAAGVGGNFFINTSNELQLALATTEKNADYCELGLNDIAYADNGRSKSKFNKLRIWYDDEHAYEKGTGDNIFEIDCPWATQAMCDSLYTNMLKYYIPYMPFTLGKCTVSPLVELGDLVYQDENNIETNIGNIVIYGNGLIDISAPDDSEAKSELDYEGSYQKQLARKVTLGADYYGTSITRESGIVVNRVGADESVKAKVILNADELAFYNEKNQRALYFDIENQKYVFKGEITADSGEIAGLVIDKDDNNRGYIATKGKTSAGQGEGIFLSYNEFGVGTKFYVGTQGNLKAENAQISGRFDAILNTEDSPEGDPQNGFYFYKDSKISTNLIGSIWYTGKNELFFSTTGNYVLKLSSEKDSSYEAANIYIKGDASGTGFTRQSIINCLSSDQYHSYLPTIEIKADYDISTAQGASGIAQILLIGGAESNIRLNANKIGFFDSAGYTKQTINAGDIYTMMNNLLNALSMYGLINYI